MPNKNLYEQQIKERKKYTELIVQSPAKKKLIVSGPGTGKTHILDEVFKKTKGNKKLALTFIRKLVNDTAYKIGDTVDCKTFHEFCKGLLHSKKGNFDLQPFLSEVIQKDAETLGFDFRDFDNKFQNLDEYGPEISFYLRRGDYYNTVSFNDSVYRIFKLASEDINILPDYDQIAIDEYQDFNKLEISFLKLLEHKGPILIVGDDDQAVYEGRSASSDYIKELASSGQYKVFKPRFCSRCTKVIVEAFNAFVAKSQKLGYLKDRIDKPFECFLPDKDRDNQKYTDISFVECSTIKTVAKYIRSQIKLIDKHDIDDSYQPKQEYPTVLIIGPSHYLKIINDELGKHFSNISFSPSEVILYAIEDVYRLLIKDESSNLGWRILIEFFMSEKQLKGLILETENGNNLITLLPDSFIKKHIKIITLLREISNKRSYKKSNIKEIKSIIPRYSKELIEAFTFKEKKTTEDRSDKTQVSILLTSYKGAKGLSGGHVFLVGIHNNSLPKNKDLISNVEISQFLVALTRTRKKFFLISNKWYINPRTPEGGYKNPFNKSLFIDWLPSSMVSSEGYKKSGDIHFS